MKTQITGTGVTVDRALSRYVDKLVDNLEKIIDKTADKGERSNARATVSLTRVDRVHGNKYEVTMSIHTAHGDMTACDSTLNVYAALDIVHATLVRQLRQPVNMLANEKSA